MAEKVCPVWVGYFLASPIRKLFENPRRRLSPHIKPGMTALDLGCAMGFFSLPLAEMVGPTGRVICVDLQEKMILNLRKRARKAGLLERLDTRTCTEDSLGLSDLEGKVDFALASAVIHEVKDPDRFLLETFKALKPGARLLVVEPNGHVSEEEFAVTVSRAEKAGFKPIETSQARRSRSALFSKPENPRS